MDEDLDQIVERCATLLLSGDLAEVVDGFDALEAASNSWSGAKWGFIRVSQELAAYKGGIVVERLMAGALINFQNEDAPADWAVFAFTACYLSLALLARSKVVGERCISAVGPKERHTASELFRSLSGNALRGARELVLSKCEKPVQKWEDSILDYSEKTTAAALNCVTNLARGSRAFRIVMKDALGEGSLFDSFGFLLSPEFLKAASAYTAAKVRSYLADLVLSLGLSPDSQAWALDKGLLKVMAALYEATSVRDLRKEAKRDNAPLHLCQAVLGDLLTTPAGVEKLRAHNALNGFLPHKKKIQEVQPDFWRLFESKLRGLPWDWILVPSKLPALVVLCSWKLCTAAHEDPAVKKFGKCALCQVARYCCKEHQKLHWRTHKNHCRGARTKDASPKENLESAPEAGSTSIEHSDESVSQLHRKESE